MEFALQRKFNPAARKFLLCSVKFAPLRNDKIYGAFSLAAGSALHAGFAVRLFCGPDFTAGDKI